MFRSLSVLSIGLVAACAPSRVTPDAGDGATVAARVDEGSPEAYGVLFLLNDEATTFEVLDLDVGLDVRAARSLVHHRNGPDGAIGTADDDLFDTIAEVDEVYYVGASALDRLEAHAIAHGYVPGPDDVIGSFDGVVFTLDEAGYTLALANGAGLDELDHDIDLDRRAAVSIVENRPFTTVAELADAPYVGKGALERLRDAASR